MQGEIGFREHAHTADWELEVWAPDLVSLLEQAARGMYSLAGVRLEEGATQTRSLTLQAADAEILLVRFLSELLWFQQGQNLGFSRYAIHIDPDFNLQAELVGGFIVHMDKEIKAVTYHNLKVQLSAQGLRVTIVFDV
jgi:SHS2 domain-containing protein